MKRILVSICCIIFGVACNSGIYPPYVVNNKVMYINEAKTKVSFDADIQVLVPNPGGSSRSRFSIGIDFITPLTDHRLYHPYGKSKINLFSVTSEKLVVTLKDLSGGVSKYTMEFDWENETVQLDVECDDYFYNPSGEYKIIIIKDDSPQSEPFEKSFKIWTGEEYQKKIQDELREKRRPNSPAENNLNRGENLVE